MALFEGYERRINQISPLLEKYGMASIEETGEVCAQKGLDIHGLVLQTQPIAFENACWAYTLGAAIAIKKGQKEASEIADGLIGADFLEEKDTTTDDALAAFLEEEASLAKEASPAS